MRRDQLALVVEEPPHDETPEYRITTHGSQGLSDTEIVSLVADATIEIARELLRGGLQAFVQRDWRFGATDAETITRFARIQAALELGHRVAALTCADRAAVRTAGDVAHGLLARHAHATQEEVGALYLNGRNEVIREVPAIFRGTLNACTTNSRDLIRIGLELNAAAMIVFHNHPSGSPDPSPQDMAFTRRLSDACKVMGIELLDHIVLGLNCYVSMKQREFF